MCICFDMSVYLYIYCDVLVATNSNDADKDIVNLVQFNEPFICKFFLLQILSPPQHQIHSMYLWNIKWFIAFLQCATIAPCLESGNNSLLRELSLGQQLNHLIFFISITRRTLRHRCCILDNC